MEETGEDINNPIRYAGYQYDEETDLYYLNARMYDPKTARFLQEDTYRGQADDPLSLNLYTYCANNPITYWDPTGHWYVTDPNTGKRLHVSEMNKKLNQSNQHKEWYEDATSDGSVSKDEAKELAKIYGFLNNENKKKKYEQDANEVTGKPNAYIFYALPDTHNGGFEERAKADAERWKLKMETDAVLVAITSEEQFKEEWSKMGNKGESVQYVGMYFHSNANNLFINTDNDEYITVFDSGRTRGTNGPEATAISSLGDEKVEINNLYLYACNAGHVSHKNNNLAVTFLQNYDIISVYAWDGSMKWSKDGKHIRLAFSQDYFEGHLSEGERRDEKGMVRYFTDSSGKIQYETIKPVGSERQHLFWKFDLWETRYK